MHEKSGSYMPNTPVTATYICNGTGVQCGGPPVWWMSFWWEWNLKLSLHTKQTKSQWQVMTWFIGSMQLDRQMCAWYLTNQLANLLATLSVQACLTVLTRYYYSSAPPLQDCLLDSLLTQTVHTLLSNLALWTTCGTGMRHTHCLVHFHRGAYL